MLARLRKAQEDNESGFTLIELLVVMIIIGILAAIAIPVFLSQRAKAQDSAAKADVSTLGKEVATWYVDNTTAPTITPADATVFAAGRYQVGTTDAGAISKGVYITDRHFTATDKWCIGVKNDSGSQKTYKYSAAGGLGTGTCTTAVDY